MIAIGGATNLLFSLYVITFRQFNDLSSFPIVDELSETEGILSAQLLIDWVVFYAA